MQGLCKSRKELHHLPPGVASVFLRCLRTWSTDEGSPPDSVLSSPLPNRWPKLWPYKYRAAFWNDEQIILLDQVPAMHLLQDAILKKTATTDVLRVKLRGLTASLSKSVRVSTVKQRHAELCMIELVGSFNWGEYRCLQRYLKSLDDQTNDLSAMLHGIVQKGCVLVTLPPWACLLLVCCVHDSQDGLGKEIWSDGSSFEGSYRPPDFYVSFIHVEFICATSWQGKGRNLALQKWAPSCFRDENISRFETSMVWEPGGVATRLLWRGYLWQWTARTRPKAEKIEEQQEDDLGWIDVA